jgi:hypothetical protein
MSDVDPASLEPLFKKREKGNNPPSFSHAALAVWNHRIGETKRVARKNNPQGYVPRLNMTPEEEMWENELQYGLAYL